METLKLVLTIVFIIISIFLTIVILLQEGRSAGLGAIQGAADTYWGKNKKHSKEAKMQKATAFFGALFIIVAALLSSKWLNK